MMRRLLVLLSLSVAVLCTTVSPAFAAKPLIEHAGPSKKAKTAPAAKKDNVQPAAKPAKKARAKKAHAPKNKHA